MNNIQLNIDISDFLGETVEDAGVELMQNDHVVPFGTALWA